MRQTTANQPNDNKSPIRPFNRRTANPKPVFSA